MTHFLLKLENWLFWLIYKCFVFQEIPLWLRVQPKACPASLLLVAESSLCHSSHSPSPPPCHQIPRMHLPSPPKVVLSLRALSGNKSTAKGLRYWIALKSPLTLYHSNGVIQWSGLVGTQCRTCILKYCLAEAQPQITHTRTCSGISDWARVQHTRNAEGNGVEVRGLSIWPTFFFF